MKIKKINEMYDPFKAVTYKIEVTALFEGFDYTNVKFKLVFSEDEQSEEIINNSIKERLKAFNNLVSYDVVNIEKASDSEQIYPMM